MRQMTQGLVILCVKKSKMVKKIKFHMVINI